MKRLNLVQGSLEWHAWRDSGIGSSDIAKIMGISPFGSALDYYNEKTGITTVDHSNFATKRGNKYEPVARDKFNRLQNANYEPACFEHPEYDFILASVDGYDAHRHSLIEIKVPGKKDLSMAIRGEVPEYYNVQMQWQMGIVDVSKIYYICYDPKIDQIYITTVQRDDILIGKLFTAAKEFWSNLVRGIPPEKSTDDVDFVVDEHLRSLATEYISRKEILAEEEEHLNECRTKILQFGNGRSFKGYGISAIKTNGRKTYDLEAMREDGIDIEKYAKIGKESYTIKIE